MIEYYKSAIDLITDSRTDFRALCIAVAKANPKVLCDAAKVDPTNLAAMKIYRAEGKVAAIKFLRNVTGASLKDAHDTIKRLIEQQPDAGEADMTDRYEELRKAIAAVAGREVGE